MTARSLGYFLTVPRRGQISRSCVEPVGSLIVRLNFRNISHIHNKGEHQAVSASLCPMISLSSRQGIACRCPCVASTSSPGPVPPRSAAIGAHSLRDKQQQRNSTIVAARLWSEPETLDSVSTLPESWPEEDLTHGGIYRGISARAERFGVQRAAAVDDAASASELSSG